MASEKKAFACQFKVIHCSSTSLPTLGEDKDHPATELEKCDNYCNGWESARFCEYPQTLVVQFKEAVSLQEIQLLCHEFKIPRRIELFTCVASSAAEVVSAGMEKLEGLEFKRIGHISFDANERTNYSARELKSVYVDFFAHFLKLQITKCYTNKLNNFKQVGIISIKCITSKPQAPEPILSSSQQSVQESDLAGEEKKVEHKPEAPKIAENAEMDPTTMSELRILEHQKQKAVEIEDFDAALRLKRVIDKLKGAGKELLDLELRKREAIAVEDYEMAKKCKIELERIRNNILNREQSRPPRAEPQAVYVEENEPLPDAETQSILQTLIRETKVPEPVSIRLPDPPEAAQTEEVYEEAEEEKDYFIESYDEKIPPAVLKKSRKEEEPIVEDEEPPARREQPEPLNKQTLMLAESYTPIFRMSLLELLFSKHYYLREEGLEVITQEVTKKAYDKILTSDPEKILNAIIDIAIMMVQTKITTLGIKALTLLLFSLAQYGVDRKSSVLNLTMTEHMLDSLIDRLGDGNSSLSSKLEETLTGMVKKGVVSLSTLVERLVRNSEKASKLAKYAARRHNFLIQLMKSYQAEVKNELLKTIIDYGLLGLKNVSRDIRLEGCKVLVEAYGMIAERLYDYLPALPAAQNKILNDELKKTFGDKVRLRQPAVEDHKTPKKVANATKKKKSPSPPRK